MRSLRMCLILVVYGLFINGERTPADAQMCCQPSINFPLGKAPQNLPCERGVVFDVTWANCKGIAKVQAKVTFKGVVVANPSYNTTDPTATESNWQILLGCQAKGDTVTVTVYAYNACGGLIKATAGVMVTLNQ